MADAQQRMTMMRTVVVPAEEGDSMFPGVPPMPLLASIGVGVGVVGDIGDVVCAGDVCDGGVAVAIVVVVA